MEKKIFFKTKNLPTFSRAGADLYFTYRIIMKSSAVAITGEQSAMSKPAGARSRMRKMRLTALKVFFKSTSQVSGYL